MASRVWSRLGWFVAICGVLALVFAGSFYLTMRLVFVGREITVPDLAGLSLEEARAELNHVELYMESVAERHDDRVPKDHVSAQDPPAGTTIKTGRKVRVTVSLGPLTVAIPRLEGQTLRGAEIAVQRDGLSLGRIAYAHVEGAPAGLVLAQDPPPAQPDGQGSGEGEEAAGSGDGRLNLLVSRGPRETIYVMPDFTRRSLEDVRRAAERAGLRLGAIRRERVSGVPRGTVVRQYPQAGHPVSRQDIISLVLGE